MLWLPDLAFSLASPTAVKAMRLDHIVEAAIGHVIGRLVWLAALALFFALCVVIALYHFTIAGTIALEAQFGALYARLIIGAIYAALALVAFAIFWLRSRRPRLAGASKALSSPQQAQLIMLVEAVMLGYQLARKGARSR
ncbi:MAG: hypothetical protein ACRECA_07695 [Pseudolabrys sp.]